MGGRPKGALLAVAYFFELLAKAKCYIINIAMRILFSLLNLRLKNTDEHKGNLIIIGQLVQGGAKAKALRHA